MNQKGWKSPFLSKKETQMETQMETLVKKQEPQKHISELS